MSIATQNGQKRQKNMKFEISSKIFHEHPSLKIGVITARNVNNARRVSAIESLLRGVSVQRRKEFAQKSLDEDPRILRWREAYAKFGAKPSKYPSSIEALLKRVTADKEIPHINSMVDMYNHFSLKYVIPVGGEDMDKFHGDLKLTMADGGECFRPIDTVDIKQVKPGEIVYKDKGGVIVRRWNYRECDRTKLTKDTQNALIAFEDLNNVPVEEFEKMLYEFQDLIEKYVGGDVAIYILNEDNNSIDLEIEGLKKADDSKISEKEKIHFLAEKEMKEKKIADHAKARNTAQQTTQPDPQPEQQPPAKPQQQNKPKEKPAKKQLEFLSGDSYKEKLKMAVKEVVGVQFPEEAENIQIEYPKDETHGDYSCNIAMQVASKLKVNPRKVAEELIKALDQPDYIDQMEIAGPGFINFYLSEDALEQNIIKILKKGDEYGESKIGIKKAVVIDYSAPNIAKPLGVHHLLSTIIGQSLYDIYRNRGYTTISVNHLGDFGTQFGKLLYAYKTWGTKEGLEKEPIPEMLRLYVQFHNEAEHDEKLDDEARAEFKKLEDGDKENKELWKLFVELSMKEIEKTYSKLGGIHFDYTLGESFYEDKMQEVIDEGTKKGAFKEGEKGSLIAEFEDENMAPFVIKKSDGATLYSTRDLATFKYRMKTWDPVKMLYIVDVAQSLHFKQLFDVAKQLEWDYTAAEHVVFGRMSLPDSTMSTRKGNVILLDEVLDEAVKRAKEVIEEKNTDLPDKEHAAEVIGISAVKYNILSQNRTNDMTFEWDKMLSFEGNSSPYLQYTYARGRSIIRKARKLVDAELRGPATVKPDSPKRRRKKAPEPKKEQFTLFEAIDHVKSGGDLANDIIPDPANAPEKEEILLRGLTKYEESIAQAAAENKPNLLSNYLYDLCQKFNSYYNSVPVTKADTEEKFESRVAVVKATCQVLKNGLELLQVEVLEEM